MERMNEQDRALTQIVNNFGPLRGNVERQYIVTRQAEGAPTPSSDEAKAAPAVSGVAAADGGEEKEMVAPVKVRAEVLLELMKRSGMGLGKKDRTKVCRLAALLMGCDYKNLLNIVGGGIRLNEKTHGPAVRQVNALLEDLEDDFRLNI
jgi:hypothetical protein